MGKLFLFKQAGASGLLSLFLAISGGLLALFMLIFNASQFKTIQTATFLDTVAIPFNSMKINDLNIPIKLDNFLVFQKFHSLPAKFTLLESYAFGVIVSLISILALSLFSKFRK